MNSFDNIFKILNRRPVTGSSVQRPDKEKSIRFLNFHMDTRWCYDQESIIDVSPLALPVENIDAEENCERYGVNELPTIMLVGPDGREIRRWTEITPSEFINNYLVGIGLFLAHDVPPCRGELKEVKDHRFADGSTYTGSALCYGDSVVPEGMGVRKFDDHSDLGHFHSFILEGVCYRNHHQYMYAGISKWGDLNGWGMQVKDGVFLFGQYRDDRLAVNLTPLVQPFWNRIHELMDGMNTGMVKVQKNPDTVFVGCPQLTWNDRFGFTFRQEGDVFIGQSDLGAGRALTGYYLHLDTDGSITKGYFENGILDRALDDLDQNDGFISGVQIWSTYEYIDFDIDMCYDPSMFDISRNYLYGIVEMGETDNDIIIKANPFRRVGNRLQITEWEDETTRWFAFPRKDSIRRKLMEIQRGDGIWAPLMKDYRVDFVNNIEGSETDHLVVYRHRSCWENDTRYVFNRENVDRSEMEYYKDPGDRCDDEDLPF